MEAQESDQQNEEFWRAHFLKAQEFSGTSEEYCRANGLSKSTFQVHKRRLGFTRVPKSKGAAFVRVESVRSPPERPVKVQQSRLPDPKWLAQFIMAMVSER